MLDGMCNILAGFTSPELIPTDPKSMLWMYPLLLSIAVIYKATKTRVMFKKKFFKEASILFCTLSVVMTAAGAGLIFLMRLLME